MFQKITYIVKKLEDDFEDEGWINLNDADEIDGFVREEDHDEEIDEKDAEIERLRTEMKEKDAEIERERDDYGKERALVDEKNAEIEKWKTDRKEMMDRHRDEMASLCKLDLRKENASLGRDNDKLRTQIKNMKRRICSVIDGDD